ncbi:MAG: class I adenylate-forming enzyme family protein [Rhodobacterales bacterium]
MHMLKVSLFDQGPPPPCPAPFNMAAYVLSAGQKTPDKTALEILSLDGVERWTYGDLTAAIMGVAGGLQASGLSKGDRILLRIGNQIDFPILFLASIAGGFVPIPTSTQLTEPEVRTLISDLNPALVVFGKDVPCLNTLTCSVIGPEDLKDLRNHPAGVLDFGDPNRLAYLVTTSGTSGKPRAVMHAHRAIWARRMMWGGWYGLSADDRLMHAGAFNWTYTLGTGLMDPWAIGATALIPDVSVAPIDLPALINKGRATIFAAAPGIYRQILKANHLPAMPTLRHGLSAGEKLSPAVRSNWERSTGCNIHEALGMSEVSTFISSSPRQPSADGASGKPQHGRRVAVLSPETFAPVPIGQSGILAVSRNDPGLMLGYYGADSMANMTDEWFVTGDIVAMDSDANVTYQGRADDMMNAGGYRVSPIEVETTLNTYPGIVESAAVSVEIKPDTFVIAAYYHSDIDLDQNTLAAFCAERLARYKCPRLFLRVTALPKGANNKLQRAALRKAFKVEE